MDDVYITRSINYTLCRGLRSFNRNLYSPVVLCSLTVRYFTYVCSLILLDDAVTESVRYMDHMNELSLVACDN